MIPADSPVVALTIVTRNQLHYARALTHSLRAASSEVEVVACVVDGGPQDLSLNESFRLVPGEQLGVSQWPRFRFQYPADELCYAVKPFFLEWAMTHVACSALLYFDADRKSTRLNSSHG